MYKAKPKIIYLDSSDYSQFCQKQVPTSLLAVQNFLRAQIKTEKIIVVFSYPIVWELLQNYSEKNKPDRIKRARTINELCGLHCFRFFSEISKISPISTTGKWFPLKENQLSVDSLKEAYIKGASLNRKHRGELRKEENFIAHVKKNKSCFETLNLNSDFIPFSKEFVEGKYLYKYFLGEISRERANQKLYEIFTNLEIFLEYWYENLNFDNPFKDLISTYSKGLIDPIIEIRDAFEKLPKLASDLKTIEKDIRDSREISFDGKKELFKRIQALKKRRKEMESPTFIEKQLNKNFRNFRFVNKDFEKSYIKVVRSYIRANVKKDMNLNSSDLGDIMHATHLPYCDLWRGDRRFSNLLISEKVEGYEKIVPRLIELPNRIKNLVS